MSTIMNRSIPETSEEVDRLVTSIANEIEIFNRCFISRKTLKLLTLKVLEPISK